MPGKSPSLYDLKKTTFWFAVASIILLIGLVAMVFQDSHRDWKQWQRKFMEYSRQKVQAELEAAQKALNQKDLESLQLRLEEAQKAAAARKDFIVKLKRDLSELDVDYTKANVYYQNLKQYQDSDRYYLEEHQKHGDTDEANTYAEKLAAREREIHQALIATEKLAALQEQKKKEIETELGGSTVIEKEIQFLTQDITRLQEKIEKLKPDWRTAILNAPMLDFMNPTYRIQQAVVEHLYDDYYFTRVEKVDRCITCHLGIDQKGFEDAPQPFRTHPNLELYLSADSPHPLEAYGCTSCHGGNGHSVNFTTASHTPDTPAQAAEWKKKYNWHPMKHWADKMLPSRYIEASCAKCHQGVMEVPQAPKLNEGRRLARESGCYACHKVDGMHDLWKIGPDLTHVQSKLDEDWMIRWLHNPKEFRPSTQMPRIFHLSNTSDPESIEKNNASIAAISTYLLRNSEAVTLQKPPVEGNAEAGKKAVEEVGCLGCHSIGSFNVNHHGPELSGLGSKLKPDWLYTWLKNPKHYAAQTRMPDLRLTDQEAADITQYLLQSRNEKFESLRAPRVKPEVVDEMVLGLMTGQMRHEDAQKELANMSDKQKMEYLGKKMIGRQGCFACHDIKGFENATPIGTEITHEGSKEVAKLDFGFVDIAHTRHDWFEQKLKNPRIFDQGKVRSYQDKLRMPQFDFTDYQVEALTTFLLSLQKAEVPMEMKKQLSYRELEIEKGRWIVEKFHCQGCHTMDGEEGAVRVLFEDMGFAPPRLTGEGLKVQEPWLYHFLEEPFTIRPWLRYRMPTFGFHHPQLNTLVSYFNHLSGVDASFTANEIPPAKPEDIAIGREIFKAFQCMKCHQSEAPQGLSASFLAPDLVISKDRLRPQWILDWISDPQALQEGTMMPTFFMDGQSPLADYYEGDAEKQIQAIRDYLMIFTPEEAARLTETATAPASTNN